MTYEPGSPEWQRVVTASKVAAILGASPWDSPYSTWQRMKGNVPPVEMTEAMERGHLLEPAVIEKWKRNHPGATDLREQVWMPLDDWAAATPDLIGVDEHGNEFVMDAKTAASDDYWTDDEPPFHYYVQLLWQLACHPTAQVAYLQVLFGHRFRWAEYVIERDQDQIDALVATCREFWETLANDDPPPLDDTVATYEAVRKLHPDIDRDASVELTPFEATELVTAAAALKAAEARDRAARSAVLEHMGRARIATYYLQKIARRQPNKHGVSFVITAKTIDTAEDIAS